MLNNFDLISAIIRVDVYINLLKKFEVKMKICVSKS